jgi:hypothetical protein
MLSFASCSVDNYEMPSATLSGNVMDNVTSELIENGGVNSGTIIQIFEGTAKQPILSNSFPDGHFTNAALFPGKYRLWAVGAFRMVQDTIAVTISGDTKIDIKVLPNVRLTATLVSFVGTTATVKVNYAKVHDNETLARLAVIWSKFNNPNTSVFAGGNIQEQNVSTEGLTSGERTFTITGLTAGAKYYFRAAARTNAPGNKYNYSTTIIKEGN